MIGASAYEVGLEDKELHECFECRKPISPGVSFVAIMEISKSNKILLKLHYKCARRVGKEILTIGNLQKRYE